MAQSGALGERAQLFAATGNMRACIDYAVKLIDDEGVLRTAFVRVERLVKDGTLAMMAQFAGGANTPVGGLVQWLHTCVEDGTMSNLESALVGLCNATATTSSADSKAESNESAETSPNATGGGGDGAPVDSASGSDDTSPSGHDEASDVTVAQEMVGLVYQSCY